MMNYLDIPNIFITNKNLLYKSIFNRRFIDFQFYIKYNNDHLDNAEQYTIKPQYTLYKSKSLSSILEKDKKYTICNIISLFDYLYKDLEELNHQLKINIYQFPCIFAPIISKNTSFSTNKSPFQVKAAYYAPQCIIIYDSKTFFNIFIFPIRRFSTRFYRFNGRVPGRFSITASLTSPPYSPSRTHGISLSESTLIREARNRNAFSLSSSLKRMLAAMSAKSAGVLGIRINSPSNRPS